MLSVSQKSEEYARNVERQFKSEGLRVSGDYRSEKLGAKIRDAQLKLIPYMICIGERDAQAGTVALRDRIEGDKGAMPVAEAIARLKAEVAARTVRQVVKTSAGLTGKGGENEY